MYENAREPEWHLVLSKNSNYGVATSGADILKAVIPFLTFLSMVVATEEVVV